MAATCMATFLPISLERSSRGIGFGFKVHQHADVAAGMDISGHFAFHTGKTAHFDVFADIYEDLVFQQGVHGLVGTSGGASQQGFHVGGVLFHNGIGRTL